MKEERSKIVKIASGADFLVALKGNGEVWACSVRDEQVGAWIYVGSLDKRFKPVTKLTEYSYHGFPDRLSSTSRLNSNGSQPTRLLHPIRKVVSITLDSITCTIKRMVARSNLPLYRHSMTKLSFK